MKNFTLFLCLFTFTFGFSQSLPFTFENDITTADFVDFDGGIATVTANPSNTGINSSGTVAQIVRNGGAIFGGSKVPLAQNLDFSVLTKITMKVYTTAPVGTVVKLKLEGTGPAADINAVTTVSGEWETLEFVFLGISNELNEVVFMFDFGNVGDGSDASTFYFDDVEQVAGPTAPVPATLPIDFESGEVSTDFLSYSGASLNVISNPKMDAVNMSNTVAEVVKDGGEFWAGSRVFLDGNLDLSSLWQISMKVYTTAPIGTRIKLELEGPSGRTNLDYLTTTTGEWETATWNFHGQTNPYDKINFMFDFGNIGDGSATSTFLFDDVEQVSGPALPEPQATSLPIDFENNSVLTTDFINEDGGIAAIVANPAPDTENNSATVGQFIRSGGAPWAKSKLALTNFITNMSTMGTISMKVYTEAPVGTVLKFKVESNVAGFADERDALTTVSGQWETYTWDFTNQDGPIYNVVTLMLGYTTPNDASANATFYFDDITQITTLSTDLIEVSKLEGVTAYPNPAQDQLHINSKNENLEAITIFNTIGKKMAAFYPKSNDFTVDVSGFASGVYFARVSTSTEIGTLKIIVK